MAGSFIREKKIDVDKLNGKKPRQKKGKPAPELTVASEAEILNKDKVTEEDKASTIDNKNIDNDTTKEVNKDAKNTIVPLENNLEIEDKKTFFKKETVKRGTLGVYLTEDINNKLDKINKSSKLSRNAIQNQILNEIFDKEIGKFKIDFTNNKKKKTKLSTVLIDEDIIKAIKSGAKKLNYSETDFYNKVIETSLEKYFKK